MVQPEPLSVDDALDRLVNQFSDSMAFFRELIQNSLDAGSTEVEIWFEYEDGQMIIHVDDWGAGMNREIIDTRLTRLFSSSKDGDRTKIGKFGIGFVSVFAIEPEAVCIDTSRDGEHWRIVFDAQRRFSLIRREEPVEGTKIQVFKPMSRGAYKEFKQRATEVVRYWCRHVDYEIRVEGELITEDFELEAPCVVRWEQDEELLIVAHPEDGEAFAGFYNRGLTLVEQPMIPGIAFKASSGKLEHTLTRDDVIREAGFERLMTQVHALIASELCEQVFAQLDAAVHKLDPSAGLDEGEGGEGARLEYLWRAACWHERAEHELPEGVADRAVFRSPSGKLVSPAQLAKARRKSIIRAPGPSPLSEQLEREGHLLIWIPEDSQAAGELLTELAPDHASVDDWCTALPPKNSEEAVRWQVLASQVARLLDDWGAKIAGVRLGHLDYPGSQVGDRIVITQGEFGEATPVVEIGELGTGLLASRRVVVLNADHPVVRTVAALAQSEPELAAYFAVKAFFLGRRLDAETDEQLAGLSYDARARRVGAS